MFFRWVVKIQSVRRFLFVGSGYSTDPNQLLHRLLSWESKERQASRHQFSALAGSVKSSKFKTGKDGSNEQ